MRFNGHTPTTTFAGGNPFLGIPKKPQGTQMATQKKPTAQRKSLPTFEICKDPIIRGWYAKIFTGLKPGDCIKCSTEDVKSISEALRTFLQTRKISDLCARSTRDYGDGMGRVWLVKRD